MKQTRERAALLESIEDRLEKIGCCSSAMSRRLALSDTSLLKEIAALDLESIVDAERSSLPVQELLFGGLS